MDDLAFHEAAASLSHLAERLGLTAQDLIPYGDGKAKLSLEVLKQAPSKAQGRLVLVTAINPTPAGEGKTTTSIGLADGLNHIGQKAMLCLREPSLGPCFGRKGGATGGGLARLVPSEDINLHFNGDFHAITSAHNLLAASIDNILHHGAQAVGADAALWDNAQITWRRVLDMNDRSLRSIITGMGGRANSPLSETGFDITAASEVMACLCLATSYADLRTRLGRMVIGWQQNGQPLLAAHTGVVGAMMALLKDAFLPNLVQSLEGTPALVHGGPFANIAHGCNSLIATQTALGLADWVVTEAGFGADLGAEKFFNIKCRTGGLTPACVVVVATIRALKYQGGQPLDQLGQEFMPALEQGMVNLLRHVSNLENFGIPVVVALNQFHLDTEAELATFHKLCQRNRLEVAISNHYAEGGAGAKALAELVVAKAEASPSAPRYLYPLDLPLAQKMRLIAQKIYHADDLEFMPVAARELARLEQAGFGHLPVCMAKTPASFSDDPAKLGAPRGFMPKVKSVRLSAGAGFVVALLGDVNLMPGLPLHPAANQIDLDDEGNIIGLN